MTKPSYSPAPGERRTIIIVWDIDDPARADDPRFWWDEEELARLRNIAPDMPDLSGKPKGTSLAFLLEQADNDEVEWLVPSIPGDGEEHRVRMSLAPWRNADPERTYMIVAHDHAPTTAEREAIGAEQRAFPPEVKAIRKEWLAALPAHDDDRAADLRRQLDASLKEHGFFKRNSLSAWNPDRAIEVQPGVFVQDERPSSTGT